MSDSRTRQQGLTRRSLARAISGAAAAAILPAPATAAEEPVLPSRQNSEARTEALVDAALSATPAGLTAEQRLDVRRGVRDLQKTLGDARRTSLGYDVDPATVFLAEGRR
jgi:CubicO group peptidase (beta-lactamase class C family)